MAKSPKEDFFENLEILKDLVMALVETHQELEGHQCWWDNDIKCARYPTMNGFKDAKLGCEPCSSFDRHKFFPLLQKIFWQLLEDEEKNALKRGLEDELQKDAEADAYEEASDAIKEILEKESIKGILKLVKE